MIVSRRDEFEDIVLDSLIYEYRLLFPYQRSFTILPSYGRPTGEEMSRTMRKKLVDLFYNAVTKEKEVTREQVEKILFVGIPKDALT